MQNYHWPGNVRELENVIERAVINSSENKLRLMDNLDNPQKHLTTPPKTLEKVERDHIVRVLEQTRWKVSGKNSAASKSLGSTPALYAPACENSAFASRSSSIHMTPPKTAGVSIEMLKIRHI